jgi:Flp pilus assembly protein TadG
MQTLLPNSIHFAKQTAGRSARTISGSQSGQSLVEVALITPLLLLLLIGVIEMGRFAYIGILVGSAAKAGAAYASQSLEDAAPSMVANVQSAVNNDFQNNLPSAPALTVQITNSCGCDSGGSITSAVCNGTTTAGTCPAGSHWVVMAVVQCTGTFSSLFKFPGIPKQLTISRTAIMRVANK